MGTPIELDIKPKNMNSDDVGEIMIAPRHGLHWLERNYGKPIWCPIGS
jgi:hypothetical protein